MRMGKTAILQLCGQRYCGARELKAPQMYINLNMQLRIHHMATAAGLQVRVKLVAARKYYNAHIYMHHLMH
jgi:hypothetical protein